MRPGLLRGAAPPGDTVLLLPKRGSTFGATWRANWRKDFRLDIDKQHWRDLVTPESWVRREILPYSPNFLLTRVLVVTFYYVFSPNVCDAGYLLHAKHYHHPLLRYGIQFKVGLCYPCCFWKRADSSLAFPLNW